MSTTNVLYLGMAWDIMSPLLLVPDLDKIYAIDRVDTSLIIGRDGDNWEEQKSEIKQILLDGSTINSKTKLYSDEDYFSETHYLPSKSTILEESDKDNRYYLKFNYNGKDRELIYYHHINFKSIWNDEIKDISHLLTIGTETFNYYEHEGNKILQTMYNERCKNSYVYALYFLHEDYKEKILIKNGHKNTGTLIAKKYFENFDDTYVQSIIDKY
jgi:hypothetical protein